MSDGGADRLAELIRGARSILLFTGAGISTGSGIPDYRGPQGVWRTKRPVMFGDFLASEASRVEYWEFKLESFPAIRDAEPNEVHRACVDLERAGRLLKLVTQNVDGLHRRAGTSPERLVEIHGTDSEVACLECGARSAPGPHYDAFSRTRVPPRCGCGGLLKPATISFGQDLDTADLADAIAAAEAADLAIALGSTLSVEPAASIPLRTALRGAPYAIVNRGATAHDGLGPVTLRLEGDVAEIFPAAARAAL